MQGHCFVCGLELGDLDQSAVVFYHKAGQPAHRKCAITYSKAKRRLLNADDAREAAAKVIEEES